MAGGGALGGGGQYLASGRALSCNVSARARAGRTPTVELLPALVAESHFHSRGEPPESPSTARGSTGPRLEVMPRLEEIRLASRGRHSPVGGECVAHLSPEDSSAQGMVGRASMDGGTHGRTDKGHLESNAGGG